MPARWFFICRKVGAREGTGPQAASQGGNRGAVSPTAQEIGRALGLLFALRCIEALPSDIPESLASLHVKIGTGGFKRGEA